jgi:hypothetical protein
MCLACALNKKNAVTVKLEIKLLAEVLPSASNFK